MTTPGKSIQQGQSVRIDVNLALVNVTVTDPKITSSKKYSIFLRKTFLFP
jgi:hypothetical protein